MSRTAMTLLSIFYSAVLSAQTDDRLRIQRAIEHCLSPIERFQHLSDTAIPKRTSDSYLLTIKPYQNASDGYEYIAQVFPSLTTVFITRMGGIAGEHKTFGPINLNPLCTQPNRS